MPKEIYTKDKLIGCIFEQNERAIIVMEGVKNAIEKINDQNELHQNKEDDRYKIIDRMISANEKFIKIFQILLFILALAIVVIAGAEEVLKIIPNLL